MTNEATIDINTDGFKINFVITDPRLFGVITLTFNRETTILIRDKLNWAIGCTSE